MKSRKRKYPLPHLAPQHFLAMATSDHTPFISKCIWRKLKAATYFGQQGQASLAHKYLDGIVDIALTHKYTRMALAG
jgi:hypothetical protein